MALSYKAYLLSEGFTEEEISNLTLEEDKILTKMWYEYIRDSYLWIKGYL